MKRIFAFLLAIVLFAGYLPAGAVHVHAEETEDVTEVTVPEETPTQPQEEVPSAPVEAPVSVTETVVVPETDLPGNDELFAAYANRVLYGSSTSMFGNAAGEQLTGDAKVLYDALKPVIKKIASGERASTVVGVGKTLTVDGEVYTADAQATFTGAGLTEDELSLVYSALLSDLPYEMYWYDKTTGCETIQIGSSTQLMQVQARFTVAENYRGANSLTVDTALTGAAATAAAKAQDIVSDNASKSDYKKLVAYKDAICGLVSYDDNAAKYGDFASDDDPWQLIHVFDGDSTTKVVCEGYSKAFMYLCDLSDFSGSVSAYTVTGLMGTGAHMWNIVKLEGKNYLADVTNSDAGTVGSDGSLFLVGAAGSVADGYTFDSYLYTYDATTKALWGNGGILTLADTSYTPIVTEGEGWAVSDEGVLTITANMGDFTTTDHTPWYELRSKIKKATVGEAVTAIGDYTFYGCENLQEISFTGDYPAFGANAMTGVIAKAWYLPDNATWDPDVLTGFGGSITWKIQGASEEYIAYVGKGSKDWSIDYDGVLTFGEYSTIYENPDYNIGTAPWYPYRQHIKKIQINKTVSKIGNCVFQGLPKLEEVDVGNGVSAIGGYAFKDCPALTKVILGECVSDIGEYAFAGCTSLQTVFIPPTSSLTVGNYAFSGCTALKQVGLPASGTFGKELFKNCSKLDTVYIISHEELYTFTPDDTAFKGITATVYYPTGSCTVTTKKTGYGGTLTWTEVAEGMCGSNVFWSYDENTKTLSLTGNGKVSYSYRSGNFTPWENYNSSIETITVGSGITGIGSYAFEYCKNVETVTLPETLTALNANAFASCSSLNNLLLPSSLKAFGHSEFNCGSLTDLYYLGTQERWDAVAYSNSVSNGAAAMTVHTLKEVPTTATCTQEGVQAHYAFDDTSVYDGKYDAKGKPLTNLQTVPALGHDYAETVVAPTCTEDGYTLHTCGRCGDEKTDAVVGKLGHTGGMATCKDLAICDRCENPYGELDPSNHTGGTELRGKVDPTCTEEGYTGDLYCLGCTEKLETGKTDKELGHTGGMATCKDLAICDRCENPYGELDPSNHTGGTELRGKVDPTCTEEGYTGDTYCLGCGDLLSAGGAVKENGHSYSKKVTAPTCTKKGYTTYTCDCGDSYVSDYTPVTKHTYTKKVTAPTYTKQGYTTYTCKCGDTYKSNYTKAKGLLTPSVKVANDAATGKPSVSWAAVQEASKYQVYRATAQTGTYTSIGTTTKTTFVDSTAAVGKTYFYKVKAVCNADSSLSSKLSGIVSISTKVGQPEVTLSKNTKGYPVLKWGKVEGAKKYQVYYATSENGTYKKLTTTSKLTYTHTKAAAGKEYFYKVRAYGKSTSTAGAYSEPLRAVKQLATPKLTLTVKQAKSQNILKWKKITGATSYEVQCSVNGGAYKTVATTTKLTFTHTGLTGGNSYTYRLRAKSAVSDAASAYSAVKRAVIKCAAPTVSVALNSQQKPVITWQKAAGAVKYQVYYATAKSGKYKLVGTVTGTTFTHSAAPTAKACYYKVVAVDGNGNLGLYSSVKSITTKCLAPAGVKATANAKGKPVISWNKAEGAKKYEIYVAASPNGTYKKLTTTSKLTYTYTKAKANTTYYFKITAYGSSTSSRSAYSSTVKF